MDGHIAKPIDARALHVLFHDARTHNGWQDKPVPESLLRDIFDLAKMPPTSANCSPMRLVFVSTPEGKARLKPALSAGNSEKTLAAPVTAIIANDTKFYLELPRLFSAGAQGMLGEAALGALVAGLTAYASVAFLTRYFHTNDLRPFGWYCLIFGAVCLTLALAKVIT